MKYDFNAYYDITGVYMIKNLFRKGCYVGSSVDIGNRWAQHLTALKNNRHHSKFLQRVYNKDGVNSFVFGVLEETDRDNIYKVEQKYIDSTNCIYNMVRTAGSASTLGKKKSKNHVEKLSTSVSAYNEDGVEIMRFSSCASAQRNGFNNISRAIKNSHKINGLYWQYTNIKFSINDFKNKKKKQVYRSNECLDKETGIYYNSLTELAKSLDISLSKLLYRINNSYYPNRFLIQNNETKSSNPKRITYLDTYTGVYYESRQEIAKILEEPYGKIAYRLKVGMYDGRYIKC